MPFADATPDVVVGRGVLHHLPDPLSALIEWRRVMRPDGAVVLSSEPTPIVETHGALVAQGAAGAAPGCAAGCRRRTSSGSYAMAANLHTFTAAELIGLCRDAGFREIEIATSGFAETLAMTASYATHGHNPALARRVPWRRITSAGARADAWSGTGSSPAGGGTLTGRFQP